MPRSWKILVILLISVGLASTGLTFYKAFSGQPLSEQVAPSIAGKRMPEKLERDGTRVAPYWQPLFLIYDYSTQLAVFSWVLLVGAFVWRGYVRALWSRNRFDYDIFRLLVRMRGAATRVRVLQSLTSPKNKLQLSKEMDVDWKAVDRHVEILRKHGLIVEADSHGKARYYSLSDYGRKVLTLLEETQSISAPVPEA